MEKGGHPVVGLEEADEPEEEVDVGEEEEVGKEERVPVATVPDVQGGRGWRRRGRVEVVAEEREVDEEGGEGGEEGNGGVLEVSHGSWQSVGKKAWFGWGPEMFRRGQYL